MMRRYLKLLLSLSLIAAGGLSPLFGPLSEVAAQSDCGPNLRCGQVPWKLPLMPVLVSPTPLATTAPQVVQPTDESAYLVPTPIYCAGVTPPEQTTTYRAVVAALRPAGYWPLDETTGSVAADASGYGHNGTITGATLNGYTVAGGPAAQFDGINDQVSVTGLRTAMNSSGVTVAAWMRVASSWSGTGIVFSFGEVNNLLRLTRSGGSLVLSSGAASASVSASANGTSWIHVAVVLNRTVGGGQSARLYVNGVSAATANSAPGTFSSDTLTIGSGGVGSFFAGGIAHVAVFSRALTASDISAIANSAPAGTPTPAPTDDCIPLGVPTPSIDLSGVSDMMATLQSLPVEGVGIPNPQAGFDLYSGTATFFSYILGIQSVNLGIFTPIIGFTFWSFFTFVGIKVAFLLLPIIAALVGVVRRIVQLVLDFLPF